MTILWLLATCHMRTRLVITVELQSTLCLRMIIPTFRYHFTTDSVKAKIQVFPDTY